MGLRIFGWWRMPSGDRSFLSVVLTTVVVTFWTRAGSEVPAGPSPAPEDDPLCKLPRKTNGMTPGLTCLLCSFFFCLKRGPDRGVPVAAQRKQIQLVSIRMQVQSLAFLRGLRIQHCHELWCRLQTQLGSHVAVAVAVVEAGSCSSNSVPTLGTSICHRRGPKRAKIKREPETN